MRREINRFTVCLGLSRFRSTAIGETFFAKMQKNAGKPGQE
jgi:hypothetical protein